MYLFQWNYLFYFQRTALHLAFEKENTEMIKFLLNDPKTNIEVKDEIKSYYLIKF